MRRGAVCYRELRRILLLRKWVNKPAIPCPHHPHGSPPASPTPARDRGGGAPPCGRPSARSTLLAASPSEEPEPIEGHGDRGAHVCENCEPERHQPERGEQHEQALDRDRDGHVLPDDPLCGAREHDRLGQLWQVIL